MNSVRIRGEMTEQPDPARQRKEDMEEEREDTFSCGSSSSSRRRSAETQRRLNLPRVALNSVDLPYQWEEEEEEDEKEKEKEHDNPTTTTAQAAITCQSGGEGNRRRSNSSNKSSGCNVTDDARGSNLAASGQLTFHPYAPSSVEDFTSDWVLYVMQRYHENNFKEAIQGVVRFSAERSDGCSSDDDDEKRPGDGGAHSQHILSQAYKVMVDVPDPPPTGGGEADEEDSEKAADRRKVHHLFVKVPPKRTAKFERMVRRNRTLEHEVKVYSELLQDLQAFVKTRVGDAIKLKIPTFYHSYREEIPPCDEGGNVQEENHVLVIEDLATKGFRTRDWFKHKLEHEEVMLAVDELAKFHACGLAYRMSLKEEIDEKYPYLDDDLYTSNMSKELLAKYLDSYLHFLSLLPGIQEHVHKLRKISSDVFQLLVKLRRPTDPLGTRFNTVCHGDLWMGNLMFKDSKRDGDDEDSTGTKVTDCTIIDFHSAQFLSPATDLAHLLLTSTTREYRRKHWDQVVESYYETFNKTLAEFGLILRHLGTTYNDFLYEVKRALRGQFLCVAFIIPIVIYCGPSEWRFERRRGSSVDRKNSVRHLIQMMAIHEEEQQHNQDINGSPDSDSDGGGQAADEMAGIPLEFQDLYKDTKLTQTLVDLIHTAADLDILDFQEFCKNIGNPRPLWTKTQATTGKHIPVY